MKFKDEEEEQQLIQILDDPEDYEDWNEPPPRRGIF